jgi:hypothetical protein
MDVRNSRMKVPLAPEQRARRGLSFDLLNTGHDPASKRDDRSGSTSGR